MSMSDMVNDLYEVLRYVYHSDLFGYLLIFACISVLFDFIRGINSTMCGCHSPSPSDKKWYYDDQEEHYVE